MITKAQSEQRPAKIHERHFMTSSIVYSYIGSPRFSDISIEFWFSSFDLLRDNFIQKSWGIGVSFFKPIFEGPVTIAHWLLNGRSFDKELLQLLKPGYKDGKLSGFFGIRNLFGEDGLSHHACTFWRSVRKSRYSWWIGRCWYSITSLNSMMRLAGSWNWVCSHLAS